MTTGERRRGLPLASFSTNGAAPSTSQLKRMQRLLFDGVLDFPGFSGITNHSAGGRRPWQSSWQATYQRLSAALVLKLLFLPGRCGHSPGFAAEHGRLALETAFSLAGCRCGRYSRCGQLARVVPAGCGERSFIGNPIRPMFTPPPCFACSAR